MPGRMPAECLTVLVVDDEPALREVLSLRIEDWGYAVRTAATVEEAARLLEDRQADLVISDVVLPEASGLDLLRRLRADAPDRPVILITAHGSIDTAVEAMKEGAQDFLTKPLDYGKLKSLLEAAAADLRDRGTARALEARLAGAGMGRLVGDSRPMRALFRLIEQMATSDASAIITGESGTGKEMVARTIHELSARRGKPFVGINAAAIPEGLIESELFGHEQGAFTGATRARQGCFEQADRGTLFLDEIAEMPAALQPKLLRVLEERRARRLGGSREVTFDVRVLAATNRSPLDAVRDGRLREDLFYRLNVFELTVPPLRERVEDIPLLAQHFIRDFNAKHQMHVEGFRDLTGELLVLYRWPGNVRELRNVIERAVILARSGWIEPRHLPPYLRARELRHDPAIVVPIGTTAAEAEKLLILKTLEHVGNNKAEAARRLGLDVKTIRNKLRSYGQSQDGS
ncbi:MAG TPA: sigma-54 dependent transcriptional regulator [Longimicrobiales bacterium]